NRLNPFGSILNLLATHGVKLCCLSEVNSSSTPNFLGPFAAPFIPSVWTSFVLTLTKPSHPFALSRSSNQATFSWTMVSRKQYVPAVGGACTCIRHTIGKRGGKERGKVVRNPSK